MLEGTTPYGRTQHGELDLTFERRGGRTVLVRDLQRTPLQIVRPFEITPGTLTAIIVNPTAGVMGGDTYRIRVTLREGARVILKTQSATKIHRMDFGLEARQDIEFHVASGARLEYLPERTIPFADSHFSQTLRAHLEPGAQLALLETWTTGRVLHGERLAFRRYASRTEVRIADRLEYLDAFTLEPTGAKLDALGALETCDHWASGVFVGTRPHLPEPGSARLALVENAFGHVCLRAGAPSGPMLDQALQALGYSNHGFALRT